MVAFHIQNHPDHGSKLQEAVEIFAGLCHEEGGMADFQVTADGGQDAANSDGGVGLRRQQDLRYHGRGRGLAMGAGYGDGIVILRHDLAQKMGPVHEGDVFGIGRHNLGVIGVDGRSVDHQIHIICDVFRPVAEIDLDAKALQMPGDRGFLDICAGNHTAPVRQNLRQAGHADAADADEINVLVFFECCHIFFRLNFYEMDVLFFLGFIGHISSIIIVY